MKDARRAAEVMDFLAKLPTKEQLAELKEWRLMKSKCIPKILKKDFDYQTQRFFKQTLQGKEVTLLQDILSRLDKKRLKIARDYFLDLKGENDEIKAHNKKVNPSQAKEVLITPGLEEQVEALLVTFHFLLRYLYPAFRTPPPLAFSRKQLKCVAKQNWEGYVNAWKEERIFYGRFVRFSQRIGQFVAMQRDMDKYHHFAVTKEAQRKDALLTILGTAAIAMLAVGFSGYLTGKYVGQGTLTPRPDAVRNIVQVYRERDLLAGNEGEEERRLEVRYGFNIIGDFTDDDLAAIEHVLGTRYNRERLHQIGLRTIIIFGGEYSDEVDYHGRAHFGEGAIRLFSGRVNDTGNFEHELAHILANYLRRSDANFWRLWDSIAGQYNRVVFQRGTAERGNTPFVQHYVDGTDVRLPRFGYARGYGGVNHLEDLATMVQMIKTRPEHFLRVMESFDIYLQKFEFLDRHGFITHGEHERVQGIIGQARAAQQRKTVDENSIK